MLYANVIVDISHEKLDRTFQYMVPEELEGELAVGMLVHVPFGSRKMTGYIIEFTDTPAYEVSKLKPILSAVSGSVAIESQLIALAAWIRKNYGGTMNQALKTVLPVKRQERQKEKKQVRLKVSDEEAKTLYEECVRKHHTAQARILAQLLECRVQPYLHMTKDLKISASAIRNLQEKGILEIEREYYYRNPVAQIAKQTYDICLNQAQQSVVDQIISEYEAGRRGTYLLYGVTGSGKTEVYMELIAYAVSMGRQCIMLIPEIALTFQTVRRFYERFGDRVSILHSRLSQAERYDQLERAKNGEIDIIIGPRSALFTPFSNLGFIMIDEEHENSYKSETVPKYHARETAITRAKMAGASVVLGSATPSVDSYFQALQGNYTLLRLSTRVKSRPLPVCELIDLRTELREGNRSIFSTRLQELIEDRLAKKQQIMLFINRRGLAGFVSCRECGNVIRCPHCDVSLSQHMHGRLICHYCGYEIPMPHQCPVCGSKQIGGFRAGTQKIQELVELRFPQAKTLRMDYDTTRTKDSYERILSAFADHQADILIGTQMIVKGHDFPQVTLVGVLAADMSLNISDYHAAERSFQLITQAAGRAGRGNEPGAVVIQTYQPDHFCIQAARAQDYAAFYEEEILYRRLMRYPQVWHMLHILVASADGELAVSCTEQIAQWIQAEQKKYSTERTNTTDTITSIDMLEKTNTIASIDTIEKTVRIWQRIQIIGPADAAIAKINDVYRRVLYMKHPHYEALVCVKDFIERKIEQEPKKWRKISIQFDFDPQNSM